MHLMLLDDGETYSGLYGCRVIYVPDDWDADQIDGALEEIRRGNAELREKCVVTEFK